jgi:hypothetical protein
MLIYVLVLLAVLCLIDLVRFVVRLLALCVDANGDIVFGFVWRTLSLGAKIVALVFVCILV